MGRELTRHLRTPGRAETRERGRGRGVARAGGGGGERGLLWSPKFAGARRAVGRAFVGCSFDWRSYTEQMLSRPPHATMFPFGENAQVMTHDERSGIACTLFVVIAFHTMSLPSCDALTRCLFTFASVAQCIE